jgi:hypothetical protein
MARLTKAQSELQDRLAKRASQANTHLGDIREKYRINDEDWEVLTGHHNEFIAIAQESITGKPESGKRKAGK